MKLFVNQNIRNLFNRIGLCMAIFAAGALMLMNLKNSSLYIFLCALCMAAAIAMLCYGYFKEQHKIMETAAAQITDYIAGNHDARIECNAEGELYRLFHEVNSLASILNAHAENELRAKDFLKNTISDISHQLKTPLAALNVYNGILQGEAEALPAVREFIDLSEQELDRIETLVQNLLKITKLDADAMVIDKNLENVAEMIDRVRRHFLFRAQQEQKEIHLAGDDGVTLLCDRVWLIEAIDNIVKNALDHTEKGGQIWIEWKQSASVVQIAVKDNGSGIHPEDLHYIFKRFYRSRFSKDTPGIGLGLPLAKAIIEAHNGMVEVDSELGVGAAFVINFLIPTKL